MRKYTIRALKDKKYHSAIISFEDVGKNIGLNLKIGDIDFNAEDEYPFFALIKVRLELEKNGIKLMCNGSRKDVYPSGNSASGIMAYELKMGKQATKLVCIFDPVRNINLIGTVDEQKVYREEWLASLI